MLRDRIVYLTSPEDVAGFLKEFPTSVIFKAGGCHKTMQGFGFLQERLEPREDLMTGVIKVIEDRAASNYLAERTQIIHHSPQVILFKDGVAVFEVNNWDITPDTLAEGFAKLPESDEVVSSDNAAKTDLSPYLNILNAYINDEIDDRQFEYSYTSMFREDSSLRTGSEVEVLNSIFGDVDQHRNMHMMMAGKTTDYSAIKARAATAYERLKAL